MELGFEMGFVTWEILASFAGCLAAVLVLTQLTKGLGFISKIPTQLWSFVLAIIVLYPAYYFTGTLSVSTAAIVPFNAAIVSLAANGGYEAINKWFNGKVVVEDIDNAEG